MSISTPIIKPVDGLCNLSCRYCYAASNRNLGVKNFMGLNILERVIDFFCQDQNEVEFIWHGGEPMLIGIDFYQQAVRYQNRWREKGRKITNFFQTNAVLLSQEWIDFFVDNDFFVGVSLDGPRKFHDRVRRFANGDGTYDHVMEGIGLLRRANVFNGVICGITRENHLFPKEIFDFFIRENMKKLKFTRIKNIGFRKDLSPLLITPLEFTDFMIGIFDLWLDSEDSEIEIRDIQSVVNLLLGGRERECIYMGCCDQFVTVCADGSIYGCDSFSQDDGLYFGHVSEEPDKVRNGSSVNDFRLLLSRRKDLCSKCDWYYVCQGGCAKDCYLDLHQKRPIREVCQSLERYFNHIYLKLQSHQLL